MNLNLESGMLKSLISSNSHTHTVLQATPFIQAHTSTPCISCTFTPHCTHTSCHNGSERGRRLVTFSCEDNEMPQDPQGSPEPCASFWLVPWQKPCSHCRTGWCLPPLAPTHTHTHTLPHAHLHTHSHTPSHSLTHTQDGNAVVWDGFLSQKEIIIQTSSSWVLACSYAPSTTLVACRYFVVSSSDPIHHQ